MIARVLDWLGYFGVERAVFSLGYRPDAFVDAFPSGEYAGVELGYAIESEPLDTAGAIRFAAEQSGLSDETIIVVNGDVLTDVDLEELISFHHARAGSATIALTPVEDPSAYGVVPTDDQGRVHAFIEKPNRDQIPTRFINAGVYVLEPSVLAGIDPARRVSIEREIFPRLVEQKQLFAMASELYWLDTGTPERFLQAQFDVLGKRRRWCAIPESEELASGVYRAPGAVLAGEVLAQSFIGTDARLDEGSLVERSVIGNAVHVGAGAQVRSSVLLSGAVVMPGARVDSSIIGPLAVIGAGATLGEMTIVGAGERVPDKSVHLGARLPS